MQKFVWVYDDQFPRIGPPLIRGQEYDAGEFPPHIVEIWIREGRARPVKEKKKDREVNNGNANIT